MSNKMSKYLSRKIKFITVFPMAAVVFIHAYNFKDHFLQPTTRISEGFKAAPMFEYFFSNALLRFAVPMFFMISGFLFFFSYENSLKCYTKKLKSRSRSVLVPFVIWTALSGILVTALSLVPKFSTLPIIEEKAFDWAHFYLYLLNPAAFQLWFLQQLMIFFVLAPLIYLLIKYTRGFILALLAIPWAMDYSFIINFEGLFAFSIGAAIAIMGRSRDFAKGRHRWQTVVFTAIWIALSLSHTFLAALTDEKNAAITVLMLAVYKLNEMVGVAAMWLIFDHISKRVTDKKGFIIAATHVFFVYVLHEPLQHLCFQLSLRDSASTLGRLSLYICLPLSIGAVCVIVSMALRKNFRKLHKLLTGGR